MALSPGVSLETGVGEKALRSLLGVGGKACKDRLLVQVHALGSSQSPRETLDLFVTREAAEAELREILEDEPNWRTSYECFLSSWTNGRRR